MKCICWRPLSSKDDKEGHTVETSPHSVATKTKQRNKETKQTIKQVNKQPHKHSFKHGKEGHMAPCLHTVLITQKPQSKQTNTNTNKLHVSTQCFTGNEFYYKTFILLLSLEEHQESAFYCWIPFYY